MSSKVVVSHEDVFSSFIQGFSLDHCVNIICVHAK